MGDVTELISLFGKITTTDHDSLVNQFSQILRTDLNVARFFLEASSWSVEAAVHAYLAETEGRDTLVQYRSVPSVAFLSDLSALQSTQFQPNASIDLQLLFKNDGQDKWPQDTRLVQVDGENLGGVQATPIKQAIPGECIQIHQRLQAPPQAGTYVGTWRLVSSVGYFGDPIWIIITVVGNSEGIPEQNLNKLMQTMSPQRSNDDDTMEL